MAAYGRSALPPLLPALILPLDGVRSWVPGVCRVYASTRLPQVDNTKTWFIVVSFMDLDGDGYDDLIARVPYRNSSGDHLSVANCQSCRKEP